jgi:predicted nucleic acid-binding protein
LAAQRAQVIERKGLVLDANILLRAVFGRQVRHLLEKYEEQAMFYTPDICFRDAQKYTSTVSKERGLDADLSLSVLEQTSHIVVSVDLSLYEEYESAARGRIEKRDANDWPVVAVALMFDLPIWTEDQDFFGSGIAIWTTDRVELYLQPA